jgi:outer membrane protein OmpA-like peptidoglycan-associated protein
MPGVLKKINDSRILVVIGLLVGLSGCSWLPDYANPIEWFRGASGASKNDASDQGQRNAENLAAGSQEPYPNLSTVPAVPDQAMSRVDLDKLQKGLVADRAHAKYSETQLSEGHGVPPIPGSEPQVALAPPLTSAPSGTGAAPAQPRAHPPPAKGSEAPPQESPLTSPTIGNLPQGQLPRAAPPPPPGAPAGAARGPSGVPADAERGPSGVPGVTASPAGAPPTVVIAPPPLPPPAISPEELAAVALPPQVAPQRRTAAMGGLAARETVRIAFAGDGTDLSAEDQKRLAAVAGRQKQGDDAVRVIGYGGAGSGADAAQQKLQSFGTALDRANAVAAALTKLGVPAGRITVQTAPPAAGNGTAAGQVAVLLER